MIAEDKLRILAQSFQCAHFLVRNGPNGQVLVALQFLSQIILFQLSDEVRILWLGFQIVQQIQGRYGSFFFPVMGVPIFVATIKYGLKTNCRIYYYFSNYMILNILT